MDKSNISLVEGIITFQGEGPDTGKRMLLTRFKNCNKSCSWCDTKDKIANYDTQEYTIGHLQKLMQEHNAGLMITGGEPTMAGEQLRSTTLMLTKMFFPIANVETNGFHLRELMQMVDPITTSKNIKYIYSPKIFSNIDYENEIKNIELFCKNPRVYYKVVYDEENPYMEKLFSLLCNSQVSDRVFIMPKGITRKELISNIPNVFKICRTYKFNFSSRSHIVFDFV